MKKIFSFKFNNQTIATTGLLLALVIIFQFIGNYIPATVNPNLSLIPVTIGAIMFGPVVGAILGFFNGLVVLCSPSTIAIFMAMNVWATVVTCLLKCTLAGFLAGLVYKLLEEVQKNVGIVLASILVPFINTLTFCVFSFFLFNPDNNTFAFIVTQTYLLINFGVEIGINVIATPLLVNIIDRIFKRKEN